MQHKNNTAAVQTVQTMLIALLLSQHRMNTLHHWLNQQFLHWAGWVDFRVWYTFTDRTAVLANSTSLKFLSNKYTTHHSRCSLQKLPYKNGQKFNTSSTTFARLTYQKFATTLAKKSRSITAQVVKGKDEALWVESCCLDILMVPMESGTN